MDSETHADRATPGVVKRLSFLVVAILVILAGAAGDGQTCSPYPIENTAICNAAAGGIVVEEALGMPAQPTNVSPADSATDISLNPTLQSSAFSDNDTEDTHLASQWQITATSEDYTSPVFDSGPDGVNLTQIAIPANVLSDNTTYYWHVKHQDSQEAWSEWSSQTWFRTLNHQPGQPTNVSPPDNATPVSLNPTLQSSPFSDPDINDSHAASQWQITATLGDYTSPVFDIITDNVSLTQIAVPAGKLNDNTAYYWRVKHGDNHGAWSEWSLQTSFATLNHPPVQPTTISPLNGDNVTVTVALQCSAFSDPDSGDTHAASRWQITRTAGDYSSTVVDDITVRASDLTTRTTIAGVLRPEITYYWRVRHQDNHGAWTEWSAEASFTTVNRPPDKPADLSPKSGALGVIITPRLEAPLSDPDGAPDYYASQWQITTIAGDYTSTVWDYTSNASYVNVPEGVLDAGITYYWRVRHQDKQEDWSEWSDEASFTVRTAFPSAGGEGGLPFWVWLLVALAGAAVVAAAVAVVLRLRRVPQKASRPERRRR
jgi:hypothetical protein